MFNSFVSERVALLMLGLTRKFAFGHDDLEPISETFTDGRNGWGASVVDAMTTMVRYEIGLFCGTLR